MYFGQNNHFSGGQLVPHPASHAHLLHYLTFSAIKPKKEIKVLNFC